MKQPHPLTCGDPLWETKLDRGLAWIVEQNIHGIDGPAHKVRFERPVKIAQLHPGERWIVRSSDHTMVPGQVVVVPQSWFMELEYFECSECGCARAFAPNDFKCLWCRGLTDGEKSA